MCPTQQAYQENRRFRPTSSVSNTFRLRNKTICICKATRGENRTPCHPYARVEVWTTPEQPVFSLCFMSQVNRLGCAHCTIAMLLWLLIDYGLVWFPFWDLEIGVPTPSPLVSYIGNTTRTSLHTGNGQWPLWDADGTPRRTKVRNWWPPVGRACFFSWTFSPSSFH